MKRPEREKIYIILNIKNLRFLGVLVSHAQIRKHQLKNPYENHFRGLQYINQQLICISVLITSGHHVL